MLHPAIPRPFHWGALSSLLIMLASAVGCADGESDTHLDDLDAGVVFDASPPMPAPDLRFKWVGVQTRTQIEPGGWLESHDPGPGQIVGRTAEGAVGALPFGFVDLPGEPRAALAVDGGAADGGAAAADAGTYGSGLLFQALFTPLSPMESLRVHMMPGTRGSV